MEKSINITKMKKVMAAGTFDLLHPGHIDFLKQAKKEGDYLIIVIATDETSGHDKGKPPRLGRRRNYKYVFLSRDVLYFSG